ncbi:hypothetical protein PUR71_23510 [Streptomyces sp. SP17BM10]|uniref:hypothetical protein n=1 Tax=Streptomyces sp. SP17BM10 TaxID=3002530 RepID=UPI002E7A7FFA|nr:hypothetical protein [Streptomyces sp. SP17BM10]MEE1785847.1 hypothetical protein [Streptomyces sp. SP17BM10]
MRANHATRHQEPDPLGVTGARRAAGRWLRRPRVVAVGGALLAQLWGVGATGAFAATADPLPAPADTAVRRALHGTPGQHDKEQAERPGAPARTSAPTSPGLVDGPAGTTGTVNGGLQERIRAGGLPLPGQRAAVPDAFALASGLLGTVPPQGRPTGTPGAREGGAARATAAPGEHGGTRSAHPAGPASTARKAEPAPAEPTPAAPSGTTAEPPTPGATPGSGHTGQTSSASAIAVPGTPSAVALADTATVTAGKDGSGTATAVLTPIAAGLLLTGAAMWKHRGLPRGH